MIPMLIFILIIYTIMGYMGVIREGIYWPEYSSLLGLNGSTLWQVSYICILGIAWLFSLGLLEPSEPEFQPWFEEKFSKRY